MNIVIGSGPAGLASAAALIAAGEKVFMLDAGVSLAPSLRAAKDRLGALAPEHWRPSDLAYLSEDVPRTGVEPDKKCHGSDYAYERPAHSTELVTSGAAYKPSYAVGGLGSVWGGAVMPYADKDIADWPIRQVDLLEGYGAVSKILSTASFGDDHDGLFPDFGSVSSLPMSRQTKAVWTRLTRNRRALRAEGLTAGRARLAVKADNCVLCGLCLRGCPRDAIYSGESTLNELRAAGMLYESGLIVRAVRETGPHVEVEALDRAGAQRTISGCRVFLGAGVVNTTEIMARSMGWLDRPITILDSQYFLVPVLSAAGAKNVEAERLHTLSQLFLTLQADQISPFTIFLQSYSYNDMLRDAVIGRLRPVHRLLPISSLLGHLMVLGGYLHSEHSGRIQATLKRLGADQRFELVGQQNAATRPTVRATTRKLTRMTLKTGLLPLGALTEITAPGRSFHSGGSFPMSQNTKPGATDRFGRPYGFSRLHLVDSSVFPSIPATTITLSVMANAWRIATAAARGVA